MSQTEFNVETMEADMNELRARGLVEEVPKKLNMARSEASHKAWETRRRNKEAAKPQVTAGGITAEQAGRLEELLEWEYCRREAFAQAEQELKDAIAQRKHYIESITAK